MVMAVLCFWFYEQMAVLFSMHVILAWLLWRKLEKWWMLQLASLEHVDFMLSIVICLLKVFLVGYA